jgi:hypothetical protein
MTLFAVLLLSSLASSLASCGVVHRSISIKSDEPGPVMEQLFGPKFLEGLAKYSYKVHVGHLTLEAFKMLFWAFAFAAVMYYLIYVPHAGTVQTDPAIPSTNV